MKHYSARPQSFRAAPTPPPPPEAIPYTQGERNEIHAAVLEFIRAGRVETFARSANNVDVTKTVQPLTEYQRDLLELTALDVLGAIDHEAMPARLKKGTPARIIRT